MNRTHRSEAVSSLFPEVTVDGDGARAVFIPNVEHEGQPGWVQGGFIATVVDYVCASAATEAFGSQAITGNLTVRYGAPVLLDGGPYIVRASVASEPKPPSRLNQRRAVRINGSVVGPDGHSLVTASGLFVRHNSRSRL